MKDRASKGSKPRVPLRMIAVDKLLPSPDNKRGPITQKSIESLARSIGKEGVVQPIVVRAHPTKDGFFEIRAGERRWRAASHAGLPDIPAIVRVLDDQEALSVTLTENLQRENLHPLQEGETFQQAFDRGYDIKVLAARTGKSVKFIARRAALTRLVPVWREEILKPETPASRLSVAHLELVARLPEQTQEALAEGEFRAVFGRGFPTVQELARVIDSGLRSLHTVPWKINDDTLLPEAGACTGCPKRQSQHPLLFDGVEPEENGKIAKGDRCLDPACYVRKEVSHLKRCEERARNQHPDIKLVQIGFAGLSPPMREAFGDRISRLYNPTIVSSEKKGAVPVMQIDGPKAGSIVYIKPDTPESQLNGRANPQRPRDASGKVKPLTPAERRLRLQKRRDAFLVNKVEELLAALTPESIARTVAEMATRTDKESRAFDPLSLVLAFGTSHRADHVSGNGAAWKRYESLVTRAAESPNLAALHEVTRVWRKRLASVNAHTVTDQAADARRVCQVMGIDVEGIETQAVAAIPTPKSWAAELAKGATEPCPFEPNKSPVPQSTAAVVKPMRARARNARRRGLYKIAAELRFVSGFSHGLSAYDMQRLYLRCSAATPNPAQLRVLPVLRLESWALFRPHEGRSDPPPPPSALALQAGMTARQEEPVTGHARCAGLPCSVGGSPLPSSRFVASRSRLLRGNANPQTRRNSYAGRSNPKTHRRRDGETHGGARFWQERNAHELSRGHGEVPSV